MIDPGAAVSWGMLVTILLIIVTLCVLVFGVVGIFVSTRADEVRQALLVTIGGLFLAGLCTWGFFATETLRRMVDGS